MLCHSPILRLPSALVCALMEAVHTVSGMNYKRDPLLVPESLRRFSHEYKGPADQFDSYWLVLHPM